MNYQNITNCFLNLQKENQEYQNKKNKLILMHIHSNDCLENIIKICSYFKFELYIYISLLMNNKYKIYLKNELRNFITYLHNDSTKLGQVFDYDEILNYLNNIKNSKITKIDLIHDNHYVSYGNSKLYLFILDFY
jgi:tRNA U34 5-carboxymethylaminomethyl modifying enzyme MnmG/GidA